MNSHNQSNFGSSDERSRQILAEIVRLVVEAQGLHRYDSGQDQAERLGRAAILFLSDNTDKTPEELAAIARAINVGGAHTGGLTVRYVKEHLMFACPRLVAACLYEAWQGGKGGFQFLPDPAETDPDVYEGLVWDLMEELENGAMDPRHVLMNGYSHDLNFYDSLPERFTVYRGTNGISAKQAAAGVCWTTSRAYAEWFAGRLSGQPVVVSARVHKDDVRLAFSNEHEVVVSPRKYRVLKFRGQPSPRPKGWGPELSDAEQDAVYEQFEAADAKLRETL